MNDTVICAWRELLRRKRRTITNIFGYALAVAMMIVLVGSLLSSKQKSDQILSSTGTHFMAFLPACTPSCLPYYRQKSLTEHEGFIANGISTNLISLGFVEEVRKLPAVRDASPFLLFQFRDSIDNHLFTVGGFDPENTIAVNTTTCAPADVISGRFLAPVDSGKVMVDDGYALSNKIHVNDRVAVAADTFTVIGIVNTGIRPAKANIYMTYRDAKLVINKKIVKAPISGQANIILVEARNANMQDAAIQSIKDLFPAISFSSYQCYKPAARVMGLNENAVWAFMIVIGIATILGSVRSQFSSVIERRRDIAVLKSIGWSNRDVVYQILVESVLQATVGGIFGCLIAAAVVLIFPVGILGDGMNSFKTTLWVVLGTSSFFLSLVGGVFAGIFPAFLAARQQPARALRSL